MMRLPRTVKRGERVLDPFPTYLPASNPAPIVFIAAA